MRNLVVLLLFVAAASAFDCFGRNNTCTGSHMECDTGYTPFCEHVMTHEGPKIGFCTCDKACNNAADCSNAGADGCPPMSHPTCDMMHHVCHCFGHDNVTSWILAPVCLLHGKKIPYQRF